YRRKPLNSRLPVLSGPKAVSCTISHVRVLKRGSCNRVLQLATGTTCSGRFYRTRRKNRQLFVLDSLIPPITTALAAQHLELPLFADSRTGSPCADMQRHQMLLARMAKTCTRCLRPV